MNPCEEPPAEGLDAHSFKHARSTPPPGVDSSRWPPAGIGRVEFLGFVEDRQSLFQRLDVLMVPSVNEGFGRTLVEAMLADVAVVATDSGGHREIIKHGLTGVLVPPDDVAAFAEAICQLARDPHARRRLSVGYDPDVVTGRVAEIYRQLPRLNPIRLKWRILRDGVLAPPLLLRCSLDFEIIFWCARAATSFL